MGFITLACQKENQVQITYVGTDAVSAYNLQYLDADGKLNETTVFPESEQDQWRVEFMGNEGDIVYVSGKYNDINSALQLMILLDGKVYKEASNQGDTLGYLTVSGTIPYSN